MLSSTSGCTTTFSIGREDICCDFITSISLNSLFACRFLYSGRGFVPMNFNFLGGKKTICFCYSICIAKKGILFLFLFVIRGREREREVSSLLFYGPEWNDGLQPLYISLVSPIENQQLIETQWASNIHLSSLYYFFKTHLKISPFKMMIFFIIFWNSLKFILWFYKLNGFKNIYIYTHNINN